MSRRNISAHSIKVHNTITTRKPPRPKSAKPTGAQNEIAAPKRTFVRDPTYMKNGIELVEVVGKLAPIRFVVKKTKSKRRRPRPRKLPAFSDATMAYVRRVRDTFMDRPEVYDEFVAIMTEMNSVEKGSRMVQLIERVVLLFDGHPELIFSFDAFLPERYELDLQDDAVVVKVYEDWESLEDGDEDEYVEEVDADAERPETARSSRKANIDETVEYVRGIKKTFSYRPEIYREFSLLLQAYHMGTTDELHTIRSIVRLFQGHPNLVLGFNEFLPKGCAIHMYDTKKYTIDYRDKQGAPCTTTINT